MIPLFKVHTPKNIGKKLEEVFNSGFITEGEYSDKFEKKFGRFVENENCSLVNSCTSALTLAYHVSGLDQESEIITTPMTCMATNEPAFHTGARLVFADIDPKTGNIDPESVRKKINSKTKCVVGVHWAGQPFDIGGVQEVIQESGLDIKLVEDAAHALGASYHGKQIGSHSDFVCFSFQAIKHLTTVDGGAICSKNKKDDKRIKKLRWFGLDRQHPGSRWEQDITECGYKFHMNNVNAAIGLEQMKSINELIESHKSNGAFFDSRIENSLVTKLKRSTDSKSSHWIYTLLVDDREDFKKYLFENKITSDVVHVRNDKYSVFDKFKHVKLPGADYFCQKMINIPVGWWLSPQDVTYIVDVINKYRN